MIKNIVFALLAALSGAALGALNAFAVVSGIAVMVLISVFHTYYACVYLVGGIYYAYKIIKKHFTQ